MAPLVVDIPHRLGAAEAKRRIKNGAGGFTRFLPAGAGVEQRWAGDILHLAIAALGQELKAEVAVAEAHVRVSMILPPALAFVRQAIEAGIRQGGSELLEDKRA